VLNRSQPTRFLLLLLLLVAALVAALNGGWSWDSGVSAFSAL
jgi:hypothetical protein